MRSMRGRRWMQRRVKAVWPSPMPSGETLDDFVGRTAVEYVEGYGDGRPGMMFGGFPGPHDPRDRPKGWYAKYEGAAMDAAKGEGGLAESDAQWGDAG